MAYRTSRYSRTRRRATGGARRTRVSARRSSGRGRAGGTTIRVVLEQPRVVQGSPPSNVVPVTPKRARF